MKRLYIYVAACIVLMTSCAEESFESVAHDDKMPVSISSVYPVSGVVTRADANGFVAEDEVGIFIVDYNQDGTPGELKMNGVRAANALFEYDGSVWKAPYHDLPNQRLKLSYFLAISH